MINKKQKKQILVASLVLISILALFYFQTDKTFSVAYNNQCSLSSCPSGYSLQEKYCEGKTCYGVCEKPVPSYCGSYGSVKTETSNFAVVPDSKNYWFEGNQISESPSKCYKVRAGGELTITDRNPGGWLYSDSESHRLIFGGVGMEKSICSTQNEFFGWTDWRDLGHGSYGTSWGAYGKYISYKDTSCGSMSYGSEGNYLLIMQWREAEWIDDEVITQKVQCSFECSTDSDCGSTGYFGSKRCSGGNVVQGYESNKCQSYQCTSSQEEKIVEFCNYGCESGSCIQRNLVSYYRLSNNQCSLIQIYESDKTQNDYTTLSICQSHIQEQDILVYRLDDNCNSAYIKVSQRTANDYDSRAECMSQVNQKVKYYRLEDNKCSEIIIYPSDKTSDDYNTLAECKDKMDGGDPPKVENLIELILGGITILLLIIVLVVWLVKRK